MNEVSSGDLWAGLSQHLRGVLTNREFETWFAPLGLSVESGRALLTVPNRFFADWIRERYQGVLLQALKEVTGHELELAFQTTPGAASPSPRPRKAASQAARPPELNKAYSFDTFVVGPCNELAHAACRAVSEQPGVQYNPLLIFGGAGLGKTHLMTAVGLQLHKTHTTMAIHYGSAEAFANELIQAVRFDGLEAFRLKYRRVDCLLMDDIQFLAGRERTQEEFFHTFNTLYEAGKQIILTSDKMPREVTGLEKRLKTRFEWGLMADLQPPEEETKVAILQHKAAEAGLDLSREVATFLARRPETNVRVLEGYLTRIIAVSRFQGVEVTPELARRVMGPLVKERKVTVDEVIRAVSARHGVKVGDLKGPRKTRQVSQARQVAMFLARRLTGASFPEIGRAFGGKDHSTVVKGVQKISERMAADNDLAFRVREMERDLLYGEVVVGQAPLKD